MFRGSVPPDLWRIIGEQSAEWKGVTDVYVGCSGNFTIERTLSDRPWRLHGNDVTIYSGAIGSYFAGQPFGVKVRDAYDQRYGWLNEFCKDDRSTLATIMLCSTMLQGVDATNPYYDRLRKEYETKWDQLHYKTLSKIDEAAFKLDSFYLGDVLQFVKDTPKDQAFVTFPPFFAGDYEQQFRGLDKVFDWPEPDYDIMDEDGLKELFELIQSHRHWAIGNNVRRPEMEEWLRGKVQTTNRGVTIYVYASGEARRQVMPRQELEPLSIRHLRQGDELGNRMSLRVLSDAEFSSLRSRYMNANIRPGAPSLACAVIVDRRIVGAFAYSFSPTLANWSSHMPGPTMYLLSDFPVADTDYPRLSKLVLYAATSREAQQLCQRGANKLARSVATTAYAKGPVSMKYRGLFNLLKRTELGEAEEDASAVERYTDSGYQLQYGMSLGQWTLAEGLQRWKQKHGKRIVNAE
jgi:hypothetical protein